MKSHLLRSHPYISERTRASIVSTISTIPDVAKAPNEIVWPVANSKPIPHLDPEKTGFECPVVEENEQECRRIFGCEKAMREHLRKDHNCTSKRRRGRPKKGDQPRTEVGRKVRYQQFFRDAGAWKRLFEVMKEEPGHSDKGVQAERQVMKKRLSEIGNVREEARKKRQRMISMPGRYEANAWLVRTGWAKYLHGMDPEELGKLLEPKPSQTTSATQSKDEVVMDPDEEALELTCKTFTSIVFKAQAASQPNIIGRPANFYISRREFGGESNEKPFYAQQMAKTIQKYMRTIHRIMRFIWHMDDMVQNVNSGQMPAFTLTAIQQRHLCRVKSMARVRVTEEDDQGDNTDYSKRLQDAIVQFWISILDHDIGDSEYSNALVGALAVLGIEADGGWKSPLIYTPMLSAVVTTSKMIVLYKAYLTREEEVNKIAQARIEEGFGEEDAKKMAYEDAPAHFDLVQRMADRFMGLTSKGSRPSPMDFILRLRTYGIQIRYDTTEEGLVDWQGERVLFGHIDFTMSALRGMAVGMIQECRVLLFRGLLMVEVNDDGELTKRGIATLPVIPWKDLVDDPAQRKPGWSVFEDKRNKFPVDGKTWLWDRIWSEDALFEQFVDTSGAEASNGTTIAWRERRLRQYRKDKQRFEECLLILSHMWSGQGGRGAEVLTIQHRNGDNNTMRGMLIEGGEVALVAAYHKGFGMSGKTKVIHRYPPREVGELLFYDTWLVRPFWTYMGTIIRTPGEQPWVGDSPYFWEPRPESHEESDEVNDSDEEDSEQAYGGDSQGQVDAQDSSSQNMDELWDPDLWDSGRLRNALKRATLRWLGVRVNIMAWRHISIAIFRRWIFDKQVQRMIDEDEGHGEEVDEAFDLQAGHSSRIAGNIYGRMLSEAPFHTQAKRAAFRKVSTEWHLFFRFPSAMYGPAHQVGPWAAKVKDEAMEEQFRRWRVAREVDLEGELKAMVGPKAQFRGVQEGALRAIMAQKSPVVVIMGTGGGKSMLFMLPARCSTGLTIVVVPLISLREDLRDRCRSAGIECAEWDVRRPHEWAQLILVTPEAAVGEAFGQFVNRQQAYGRLDRVVIDECHVVLDSRSGWRSKILELRQFVRLQTQLVYLTATLMPSEEREFIRLMGLPAKEKIQWFRARTERKNVTYRVVACDRKRETQTLLELVARKKAQYGKDGKIIVYCETVEQTEELANELGAACFHRNAGSKEDKSGILRELKAYDGQQVFTATNALGLGVDAPTIRVVIHVGRVRRLRDYSQESGRAGRDGGESEAIILNTVRTKERCTWMDDGIKQYVWGGECRRMALGRFMDGSNRGSCGEDEQKCDVCGGVDADDEVVQGYIEDDVVSIEEINADDVGHANRSVPSQLRVEFEGLMQERRVNEAVNREVRRDEMEQAERLEQLLREWSQKCVICMAMGEAGKGHMADRCTYSFADELGAYMERVRREIKYEAYSGCWDCGVPQGICNQWVKDASNGRWKRRRGVRCQYPGVLVRAVVAIWGRVGEPFERDMDMVIGSIGLPGLRQLGEGGFEQVVEFFGTRWRVGEMESNRMAQMFLRWAGGCHE